MSTTAAAAAAGESAPLIDSGIASAVAEQGAGLINAATDKIQQARAEGPLTFRMMGFVGGLAMIVSNGIAILERFFSFHFASAVIAVYGVVFGVVIALLDFPRVPYCSKRVKTGIMFYAKFLEYAWGRGILYFFMGTLQASNWNMLDWVVGGFMIFTGIVSISVGIATAQQMRLLKFAVRDEAFLKQKWNEHDTDGNGSLDVKELTSFVHDAGVEMNRNQIAAAFLALDKNFDEKIAYEEFFMWWKAVGAHDGGLRVSV